MKLRKARPGEKLPWPEVGKTYWRVLKWRFMDGLPVRLYKWRLQRIRLPLL